MVGVIVDAFLQCDDLAEEFVEATSGWRLLGACAGWIKGAGGATYIIRSALAARSSKGVRDCVWRMACK